MIDQMNSTIQKLAPLYNAIDWSQEAIYAEYMSQAYYIAKQSTSFLGLAMIHSARHPAFLARCTDHIGEETGHERLIENDLKAMGYNILPELPITSAIYQTQYYRIATQDSLSFVGYIFFLELLAPAFGPMIMERVSNRKALSFLRVHTSADEDHIGEATKILEGMSKETREMAMTNFEMTAACYRQLLEELLSRSHRSKHSHAEAVA